MSIKISYRKDRKSWQVTYWLAGKRKRPLFAEKPEAKNFARKISLGLAPEDRESITVDEAGKKYFSRRSQNKSQGSRNWDKRAINFHHHFMVYERGIERLASVALEDMEEFRDWLAKLTEEPWPISEGSTEHKPMRLSAVSVNRCLATLKNFYVQCIRWKHIPVTPCEYLEFLSAAPNERLAASSEQYLQGLKCAPDWYKPVMQFIYFTGAPGSSVARLEWKDVDFAARTFHLFRKKGREAKWKRIPMRMTDEVFGLLILVRNLWPTAEGPVFRDDKGRALRADRICKEGSRAFAAAGIKGVTNYCMRHALASDMTAANFATEIVRQAMGHASISTTQRYANKIPAKVVVEAIKSVRGGKMVANGKNRRRT